MNFKTLFLPVGLIVAVVLGMIIPQVGVAISRLAVSGWRVKDAALFVVFFITGLGLVFSDFRPNRRLVSALTSCALINLLLAPLVAAALVLSLTLSRGAAVGLLVMACVPTTLSSATVIVRNAGGNTAWSVLMTLALTVLGTALLPVSLGVVLGAAGDIALNMRELLVSLGLLVGLPLVLGLIVRRAFLREKPKWLDHGPTMCIILVVFLSVTANVAAIRALTLPEVGLYLLLALVLHGTLLGTGAAVGRWQGFGWQDRIALAITCSQKTLPLALTALVAIESSLNGAGELGLAVVMGVLFHLQQILVDSSLAGWLARRWATVPTA